jgi:hypothetical protein
MSFVVNFQFFSSHFPVTTLGLDLFSGAYLKLLFLWWRIAESKAYTRLGDSLSEIGNRTGFLILCFFKKLDDGQAHKRRLSVNFSHAVFSLLDFLTLEDETDRWSQNVGNELQLTIA